LIPQKSENGDGESLIYGVSSMQGWRISMEDAHATVLDFAGEQGKPTGNDKRLAFFGVYDGHGGDKVALYAGEQLHQIVAKQEAFKEGDIKKALQDGFLATDRAILSGTFSRHLIVTQQAADSREQTPSTKRRFLAALRQLVSFPKTRSTSYVSPVYHLLTDSHSIRPTQVTHVPSSESKEGQSRSLSTTSRRTRVRHTQPTYKQH
jgi:hypothetical protein